MTTTTPTQEATRAVKIPTWQERCKKHPRHQDGMVTEAMIQARMQEEIDDLRAAWDTRATVAGPTREEIVKRICIGLFADYDNLTLENAEQNWNAGYAYGAVGSDAYEDIMRSANRVADALFRTTETGGGL